ncbi:hypothetical protein CPB85DRAFT_1316388 [Mucidula mucida]|nr:hypothetical protein CPB85DRAFT_1316388 [Mucidula mucida]
MMHQYTTSTCFTICEDPVASDLWRLTIPLAALHLYTLMPPSWSIKYSTAAVSYFNDALRASEATGGRHGMDSGAHFCAQMLMAIYGFAPWLTVLRASAATFRSRLSGFILERSRIDSWITAPLDLGESEDVARRLPQSLSTLPLPVDGAPQMSEVLDTSVSAAYQHSLCFLRRSWAASFHRDYHMHAAFFWLMLSSDAFMSLLAQRRPRALILLGHYCVAMDRSNGPWWMQKDWKSELFKISSRLDPQWAVWMNWE